MRGGAMGSRAGALAGCGAELREENADFLCFLASSLLTTKPTGAWWTVRSRSSRPSPVFASMRGSSGRRRPRGNGSRGPRAAHKLGGDVTVNGTQRSLMGLLLLRSSIYLRALCVRTSDGSEPAAVEPSRRDVRRLLERLLCCGDCDKEAWQQAWSGLASQRSCAPSLFCPCSCSSGP